MKTKLVTHEFWGNKDGPGKGRRAVVFRYHDDDDRAWYVELWQDTDLVETRRMESPGRYRPYLHSESYAESCAENWTHGYFHPW